LKKIKKQKERELIIPSFLLLFLSPGGIIISEKMRNQILEG